MAENLLYMEIIKQAINDVLMKLPKRKAKTFMEEYQAKIQAKKWFDKDNKDFNMICDEADIDPDVLISTVKMMKKKGLKKILLDMGVQNE